MNLVQKIKATLINRMLKKEGLQDSQWGQQIKIALRRGHFTREEGLDSLCWDTCATADLLSDDCPELLKDPVLSTQGFVFTHHVLNDNFYRSARTLVAINKRVRQLKGLELWDKL